MKKLIATSIRAFAASVIILAFISSAKAQTNLRLGIAGLNHDHVYGILNRYKAGKVIIVGIAEPNKALWVKFGK